MAQDLPLPKGTPAQRRLPPTTIIGEVTGRPIMLETTLIDIIRNVNIMRWWIVVLVLVVSGTLMLAIDAKYPAFLPFI